MNKILYQKSNKDWSVMLVDKNNEPVLFIEGDGDALELYSETTRNIYRAISKFLFNKRLVAQQTAAKRRG